MDTPSTATTTQTTPSKAPVAWDGYFPLLNKAILCLLLIFGIIVASGVDVVQVGSKLLAGESLSTSTVSAGTGAIASSEPMNFSLSVTGPGGWKNAVVILAVIFGITVVALSVLSSSGRDATRMKEREAQRKEEQERGGAPAAAPAAATVAREPEPEECNLASYKLFYSSASESDSAKATTPEKAAV